MRRSERQDNAKGSGTEPAIYNRLAVLRAERGLSRQALAEALGVNYQTIGYLERGEYNPSLELAFRIAEFFASADRGDLLAASLHADERGTLRTPTVHDRWGPELTRRPPRGWGAPEGRTGEGR